MVACRTLTNPEGQRRVWMSHVRRGRALQMLVCASVLSIGLSWQNSDALPQRPSDQSAHDYVHQHYTKTDYKVPMRDGTRLHTIVYAPKDQSTSYPVIFTRTPYRALFHRGGTEGTFGYLGPGPQFIEEGYIFVVQDVRGRYLSEGTFEVMRPNTADRVNSAQTDESSDAWDSIDWIVKHVENNNGRVGMFGISYPGHFSALALIRSHPALKAVVIEAPVAEVFHGDDYHHNGALQLLYPFMWLNNVGLGERSGPSDEIAPPMCGSFEKNYYETFLEMGPVANLNTLCFKNRVAFWNDILEHETYDEFWQSRSLGQRLKNIKGPAVLVAGSWFDDQDLYGTLAVYKALEKNNPGLRNSLIMGVWDHAKWYQQKSAPWGKAQLPVKEVGDRYRNAVLSPWFRSHLKGDGLAELPEVMSFQSGKTSWREYSSWPPKEVEAKSFFLHPDGRLSESQPRLSGKQYRTYRSDPSKPVPQIPEDQMWGWTSEVMQYDQTFASKRDDVLVYQGDKLTSDLAIAGPIQVDLYVSTSGTDADWVVKLIDVFPDDAGNQANYQMLIRSDILRGKFRNSFEAPEPFQPGKITHIQFDLPDVNHQFKSGHRLMVQVQSTLFPMFDRNPQTFMNIREASEEDFVAQRHKIFSSRDYPSAITLPVIPALP